MRFIYFLIVTVAFNTTLFGQSDSLSNQNARDKKHWTDRLYLKVQYAGAIGFISPGIGFSHARNKIETDLFPGFLPKGIGGEDIVMLTLKNTYFPFKKELKRSDLIIYPISIGGYLNYTFGNQYETFWPDYYPQGYYWWDSSLRLGFFLGGKIAKPLADNPFKEVSAYYEVGFNDLYLISYVQNTKYLKPYDILNLALGVKFAF